MNGLNRLAKHQFRYRSPPQEEEEQQQEHLLHTALLDSAGPPAAL